VNQGPLAQGPQPGDIKTNPKHQLWRAMHSDGRAWSGGMKINPKDGQLYVWIRPGTFTMGCSSDDPECFDGEKPARSVTLTKGFWMGHTATTVGAWKKMGRPLPAEPKFVDRELNPGWREEQQPIVNVNWEESEGFCEAAGLRLPTEAEWEYAARAGTTRSRYGNLDDIAWYADNSGKQRIDSAAIWQDDNKNYGTRLKNNGNGLHPVALKRPNAWQLYDMLGNLYQWTGDWYGEKYYDQGENLDPLGPPGGPYRVLRGGSWSDFPRNLRASYRGSFEPVGRSHVVGFRCVGE